MTQKVEIDIKNTKSNLAPKNPKSDPAPKTSKSDPAPKNSKSDPTPKNLKSDPAPKNPKSDQASKNPKPGPPAKNPKSDPSSQTPEPVNECIATAGICISACMECFMVTAACSMFLMILYFFGILMLCFLASKGYDVQDYLDPWNMFCKVGLFVVKAIAVLLILAICIEMASSLYQNSALIGKMFCDVTTKSWRLVRSTKWGWPNKSLPTCKLVKEKAPIDVGKKGVQEIKFDDIVKIENEKNCDGKDGFNEP